ncbi:MAG: glycoside hydrolase family 13 protein [Bacteroidetes bacterium]|nr:glycoside hydrolase family 13 protein [Bacteroidota bacterium]
MRICVSLILLIYFVSAAQSQTLVSDPPSWADEAVWYQIFVERFRNGDPSNDPTEDDIRGFWFGPPPEDWAPTPWTHDWYEQEEWALDSDMEFYTAVQYRRYGGDLQGLIEKLDYLKELGVNALYLNPINDAPSLHKFDARHYRHVDRNFGPDPVGDRLIAESENPLDPNTWQWTAADSLFLELIQQVHARDMHIILDYSWNHTGIKFWAWEDILEHQQESDYAQWYEINSFDDPATADTNEFSYDGWLGVKSLPELAKVDIPSSHIHGAHEGNLHPDPKAHIYNVTRRWLDPNGDGDPEDGIDGFRLDVAEMVPLGFWRDYRQFVRDINPEAYLVGEVWWDSWPHQMADPTPWVQGDVFDAVMNYRWYMPTRSFFAQAPPHLTATEYVAHLDSIMTGTPSRFWNVMMNLTASHDTPRISTSIYNPSLYKYHQNPRENSDFKVNRPDMRTRSIHKMILVQQFTWPGAPHIWNGDEMGMWGGDDPDTRKPLLWDDYAFEDETTHPFELPRLSDPISADIELIQLYKSLIQIRKQNKELFIDGETNWIIVDDARRLLSYERRLRDRVALVIFNASDKEHTINILPQRQYQQVYPSKSTLEDSVLVMDPMSARIFFSENQP